MTEKERIIIQNILMAMSFIQNATNINIKIPKSDFQKILNQYLLEMSELTYDLGKDLYGLIPEMSDKGFEEEMKNLMGKGKNENRDKTDK